MAQLSFRGIVQPLCSMIEYMSGNSQRKKDIYSCIIILEIGLFIGSFIALIKQLLNPIGEALYQIFDILEYMRTGNIIKTNDIQFNFFDTTDIYKLVVLQTIYIFSFLLLYKLRVKRSRLMLCLMISQVVGFSILFREVRSVLFLLTVLFFILDVFIPFGSGKYYKAVTYLRYLPDFYQQKKKSKKYCRKLLLKLFLFGALFITALRNLVPFISIELSFIFYITIVLFIWMNKPTGRAELLLKKIIIYSLFIPFVLLKDNSFNKDFNTAIIVLISIFFSIDRVMILFKELKKYMEENSLLYLLEADCESQVFLKEILDIEKVGEIKLSADLVLRQIVLHEKLDLPDTVKWINLYRINNYDLELHVVNSIEYFLTVDEQISLSDKEEVLSRIYVPNNNGILFVPLLVEYAFVLFLQDKDYEKIIEIIGQCGINIDNETKYILHKAYLETNNINAALNIKIEINDFEVIQAKMEEWQSYNRKKI